METINNVASGVSKVIWGEGATAQGNETAGTEPISGQTGKGTVDSPYDQGNSETATDPENKPIGVYDDNKTATTGSTSTDPTTSPAGTSAVNTTNVPGGSETAKPLETTDKTGVTSNTPGDPTTASDISPSNAQKNTGDPTTTEEEKKEAKEGKEEEKSFGSAEEAMKSRDPNDHSGEPMHMHDGSGSSEKKIPETQEERRESKVGMPGGQPHGKEQGTGEKVVHASGLAAEGGDFDATNPGAGSEANRLMEEKGLKSGDTDNTNTTTKSSSSEPKKEGSKISAKVDKLKEKLHIGHKDK